VVNETPMKKERASRQEEALIVATCSSGGQGGGRRCPVRFLCGTLEEETDKKREKGGMEPIMDTMKTSRE